MAKKTKKKSNKAKEEKTQWLPICMCLGTAIGSAISFASHNMVWLATGISVGVCFGVALSNDEDEDKEEKEKKKK